MSKNYEDPTASLSLEDACKNLVNAIAQCVHSALALRDASDKARQPPEACDSVNIEAENEAAAQVDAEARAAREREEEEEARAAREREEAAEREAAETADREAVEAVDRRVPVGERVSLLCSGRGRTSGPNALPQGQFNIRSKITHPDSLRTAIATVFREEPAVEELSRIVVGNSPDVYYDARRGPESRQIILTGNRLRQEIVMTVDDLAEAEVPL